MEIIKNCYIITMDKHLSQFECGAVVIENGEILDVGNEKDILSHYKADNIYDADKNILLPGFINTHTHSAMTLFRGFADDLPLNNWLNDYIFPSEGKYVCEEFINNGCRIAASEMIRSGITTFLDMYFFQDMAGKVFKEAGMRAFLSEGLINFPTPDMKDPEKAIAYVEDFINKWIGDDLISPAIAAHAPYTCSDKLLRNARDLADKYNLVFNIHLSETALEVDTILKENGVRPTFYLDNLGILKEKTILAHCVHINEDESLLIRDRGSSIAHNPQSNMKLASGIAPVNMFKRIGINVTIGTDGACSNNNLDIIEEGREAALLSKVFENDPTSLDAKYILQCLTINGAKALGMENNIGSIEKGKRADIIIIDIHTPNMIPLYNPYSQIVYSANQSNVNDVMIDGKWVMKNKNILSFDDSNLFELGEKWKKRIKG